jgi:hypothetical protein
MNNSISPNTYNASFKKIKQTPEGSKYHHSNAGLAVGSVIGGLGGLYWYGMYKDSTNSAIIGEKIKRLKELGMPNSVIDTMKKQLEFLKKTSIPARITAVVASIGCGVLIDNIRNKKAQKVADDLNKKGIELTYQENPDTQITHNGNLYYHSKDGRKKGALLGLGCGIAHSLFMNPKYPINIPVLCVMTLGGYLAGLITDSISNKKAKEKAMKIDISA